MNTVFIREIKPVGIDEPHLGLTRKHSGLRSVNHLVALCVGSALKLKSGMLYLSRIGHNEGLHIGLAVFLRATEDYSGIVALNIFGIGDSSRNERLHFILGKKLSRSRAYLAVHHTSEANASGHTVRECRYLVLESFRGYRGVGSIEYLVLLKTCSLCRIKNTFFYIFKIHNYPPIIFRLP